MSHSAIIIIAATVSYNDKNSEALHVGLYGKTKLLGTQLTNEIF